MITIMDMTFPDITSVPDFGSICLIYSKNNYKSFRLLDSDADKLNSISAEQWQNSVPNGSDALTDTGRLFVKLQGTWREVGGSSE